jgi:hypothetical protein
MILGFVLLNLFMIVGAVDLFYFHIWKYRLHMRPESRYEHKLHMAFSFLLVRVAFLLFYQDSGGYALWAAALFVIAALGTEILDVFSEGDSRASLGGLTTAEYSLHVAATILKVASFSLMFAAKPAAAWSLSSPTVIGRRGFMGEVVAMKVMAGGFLSGLLHLVLLSRRIGSLNCQTVCDVVRCKRFACCTTVA